MRIDKRSFLDEDALMIHRLMHMVVAAVAAIAVKQFFEYSCSSICLYIVFHPDQPAGSAWSVSDMSENALLRQ